MLQGQWVYLRGLEETDIPDRVRWLNDRDVNHTLNFDHPISVSGTKQWLGRALQNSNRKDFTVCLREDDRPIGYAGVLAIDWKSRKAEIYGGIGEKALWGKGLGRDMWKVLTRFAFGELALNRVYATTWTDNIGMCRINESCGYTKEGVLRQDVLSHGELRDRVLYAMLRNEYEQLVEVGQL